MESLENIGFFPLKFLLNSMIKGEMKYGVGDVKRPLTAGQLT